MGASGLPRGARVRVKLGDIDEVTLDIHGTVTERLDTPAETAESSSDADASDDDEDAGAGPIAIAVDMTESDASTLDAPSDPPSP